MESLLEALAESISNWYSQQGIEPVMAVRARAGAGTDVSALSALPVGDPRAISEAMVKEALAHGLDLGRATLQRESVGEGSTAESVERLSFTLRFVLKMQSDKALLNEARVIRKIRENVQLPVSFREAFPVVYAIREDAQPYAYLMQEFSKADGYRSLALALFTSPLCEPALQAEASRLIGGALEILFGAYRESKNPKMQPNVESMYLDCIEGSLRSAAEKNPNFQPTALSVNGKPPYLPWDEYLEKIRKSGKLHEIHPRFTSVVHGDAHLENILFRYDAARVDYRLIDPKDWEHGDYVFDMTKLAHYLAVIGPLEYISENQAPVAFDKGPNGASISYTLNRPGWTGAAFELVRQETEQFAQAHNDLEPMKLRFSLGMATHLLGDPAGRQRKNPNPALILYAEGMSWLDTFARSLGVV